LGSRWECAWRALHTSAPKGLPPGFGLRVPAGVRISSPVTWIAGALTTYGFGPPAIADDGTLYATGFDQATGDTPFHAIGP